MHHSTIVMLIAIAGCLCVFGGVLIAVIAVVKRYDPDGHFEYKDTVRLGGAGVGFIGAGSILLLIALHYTPPDQVQPLGTNQPPSAPSTPGTSSDPAGKQNAQQYPQASFKTPSGNVYCSTYKTQAKMGCLIIDHQWGSIRDCSYLYAFGPTGKAHVTVCPDDDDLRVLLGSVTPPTLGAGDYDRSIDMKVAHCSVDEVHGTTCTNSEGHRFRLARQSRDNT